MYTGFLDRTFVAVQALLHIEVASFVVENRSGTGQKLGGTAVPASAVGTAPIAQVLRFLLNGIFLDRDHPCPCIWQTKFTVPTGKSHLAIKYFCESVLNLVILNVFRQSYIHTPSSSIDLITVKL